MSVQSAKVSVIVPNYNHGAFLRERIDSVLRQDYPNIEVIVLDDCSSDDSMAILESYRQDKRIKVILRNTINSGNTFMQWRKGITLAEGEYIWIAESDDVAAPKLISTLMTPMLNDKEISMSFCQSERIDSQGRTLRSTVYKHWKKAFVMPGEKFIEHYLLGYNYICNASAVVMRRIAALQVSDVCMQYRASGDRQFWIEMAQQGKVSYSPEILNGFRQHLHKVSPTAAMTGKNILEDLDVYSHYKEQHQLSLFSRIRVLLYHLRASLADEVRKEYRKNIQKQWLRNW